jgi:hypothetical protein
MDVKKKLRDILDKYKSREYKETPLLDNFETIVSLIAGEKGDKFETCLKICYDICIRKELKALESAPN